MASKKDYVAIAWLVNDLNDSEGRIDRDDLVEHLSDYFEENNPNFDRDKFYKACYGKEVNNGKG